MKELVPEISINGRNISIKNPPYIIAELSANHNGSINNALDIIKASKDAGANAVKLQTYKADTITLNSRSQEFMINDGLWSGKSLFELYDEAHLPWEWHHEIFSFAKEIGITIFSSPFDFSAVDFLEKLDAPAYKIASFEIVDLKLIEYVASTGKPMIISTGMANLDEITEAYDTAKSFGCNEIALLHCVSGYPAPHSDYNLHTISDMKKNFDCVVGLSDHTLSNVTAICSIPLGASLIEKHVTLNRNGGGPDDSFSLEPNDLKQLCDDSLVAWQSMGSVDYDKKESEQGNAKFRRSLYFVDDLESGEIIHSHHIKSVRPGYGESPKFFDYFLGKRVKKSVKRNTPVKFNLLED